MGCVPPSLHWQSARTAPPPAPNLTPAPPAPLPQHSRHDAVAVFCGNDTALGRFSSCGQRDRAQFYPDVRDHMFTVSPHGMGLDSYRTWEVLFLGGYPLLKRSTIDELYAGLPVWIVDE